MDGVHWAPIVECQLLIPVCRHITFCLLSMQTPAKSDTVSVLFSTILMVSHMRCAPDLMGTARLTDHMHAAREACR